MWQRGCQPSRGVSPEGWWWLGGGCPRWKHMYTWLHKAVPTSSCSAQKEVFECYNSGISPVLGETSPPFCWVSKVGNCFYHFHASHVWRELLMWCDRFRLCTRLTHTDLWTENSPEVTVFGVVVLEHDVTHQSRQVICLIHLKQTKSLALSIVEKCFGRFSESKIARSLDRSSQIGVMGPCCVPIRPLCFLKQPG